MSREKLEHIRGIIWDLDGTLYQYGQPFYDACNIAAARTVMALGFALGEERAIELAYESQKTHGNSFHLFKEHGIAYMDYHHPYHDAVDISSLGENPEMTAALAALNMPMAILTNASRSWAGRVMKHINISHLFGDGKIICLEDVDFKAKSNDPAGFEKALSLLGIAASNVLVVEDMPSNLVHAKKLGLTTALVHNEKPPAEAMEYVDLVYETTLDLVRDVLNLGPRHDYSIGFSPS